jgi:hypothetical protein
MASVLHDIKGCLTARLLPEDKSYHMYKMTTVNVFIIHRIPIFTKFVEQQEALVISAVLD